MSQSQVYNNDRCKQDRTCLLLQKKQPKMSGVSILQKIFTSCYLMCFLVLPFCEGFQTCRNNSDCWTPDTYCFDNFCDGDCVPCEIFQFQPPYSGSSAKREEKCFLCIPRIVAKELPGMLPAFQRESAEELIPVTTEPFIRILLKWFPGALESVALTVIGILWKRYSKYIVFRCRQLFGTPSPNSENVNEVDEERGDHGETHCQNKDEMGQLLQPNVRPNDRQPLDCENTQPTNNLFSTNSGENTRAFQSKKKPTNNDLPELHESFKSSTAHK